MIKKFIITGMLCLFANSANAQRKPLSLNLQAKEDTSVSPIVKEQVEEYAAKINAIIQDEKRQMESELTVLQKKKILKKRNLRNRKLRLQMLILRKLTHELKLWVLIWIR